MVWSATEMILVWRRSSSPAALSFLTGSIPSSHCHHKRRRPQMDTQVDGISLMHNATDESLVR
jgi:hypothetical protein